MTKNEDRINKLFKELVPDTGKADSLAGELVRAMSRIGYRFYNDGDQLGIGYGKETCNPAGRFLGAKGNDKIAKLTADAWAVYSEEAYEKVLDILCGAVADYVEQNPDLRNQPTWSSRHRSRHSCPHRLPALSTLTRRAVPRRMSSRLPLPSMPRTSGT